MDIDKIEATWIHLVEENIYVCSFYRSQLFCPLTTFLAYMVACMLKLNNKKVLWIGDINVKSLNLIIRS